MNETVKPIDILIVDDREDGLIALEAVLGDPKYHLVRAQSGVEAIEALPHHDFAVILLDVQMPGIDGFETARRIKLQAEYRDIPIIFVTAINKDDQYVHRGYEHGAVDYVFKPFDDYVLRAKVASFIELFKKTKLLEQQNETIRESERRERYLRLAELEVESLKRYRNLADSIPHSIWRSKADGTMDYFSRVWSDYTGLTEEQSLGVGWQTAFEPDGLRIFLRRWIQAMEFGDSFEVECQIRSKAGDMRWHWIQAVPEKRLSGDVIAWLGTCTDIHERKEASEALTHAREEADAANKAKTHFLANMSHEIRTPLNSILGFTELLSHPGESPEESARYLATIRRNGTSLLKIIDEILDISKVEADKMEIEKVDVDLRAMLAELQSLLEVQSREKGLCFRFRCSTLIPARIETDPTRLRQILTNVIGNAIKFTAKGEVDVQIAWGRESNSKGSLKFQVRDTGVGIDAEHEVRLFEPFMQADSSTTRKFGGTGLGLALSRRLARALGGEVWLESNQSQKGATFGISIAAKVVEGSSFFEYSDHFFEQPAPEVQKVDESVLSGVDILVVDDASDNRLLISRFLSAVGANVDCASNGHEGVNRALEKKYDVVLMDIQMPILDGYAATSQLRGQGYRRPIIALTAHALNEERQRSLSAGCDEHLTKPIDKSTLIEQVARIVGKTLH